MLVKAKVSKLVKEVTCVSQGEGEQVSQGSYMC